MPIKAPHVPALTGISITAGSIIDRHFIIDQTILVDSALQSVTVTNPSVSVDAKNKVVYLDVEHPPQVSVVSGGGSGHEPAFTGFVGKGMLSASVTGPILSCPSADQIFAALTKVDGSKGVLAVIMNHRGDVANFKSAIAKTKSSGLKTELVVVGDDVSWGRIKARDNGRSGIAGIVLILKIVGALAATGATLGELARVGNLTASHLMSVGSALSHVHIPNHPLKDVETDEYLATEQLGPETGLGEHQLPGSHKLEVDLPGIVQNMLKELLDWSDEDRSFSMNMSTDQIVLLVNNLGGLSGLELAAITLEIALQLDKTYAIKPVRAYSGTFMSSLNEFGFSISLLKVVDLGLANGMDVLELLDAPSETTRWPVTICAAAWKASKPATFEEDVSIEEFETRTGLPDLESELPRPVPQ